MRADDRSDDSLWHAMSSGDMAALGILFDRHSARAYRYLVRSMPSPQDAEDALSEVFLEAWRSRHAFGVRGDSALPILLAIAHRITQKYYRTRSRRPLPSNAEIHEGIEKFTDVAEVFVDIQEQKDRSRWLRERIAELDTKYRNVIELSIYAEFSQEQIAAILDIPIGTVKSRLSRAKDILGSIDPENRNRLSTRQEAGR